MAEDRLAELRARAAGSRLRCEPRGCERWRLTLGEEWARIGTTDGRSYLLIDRAVRDDEARGPVVHGADSDLVVLALDPHGRPLWRTEVEAAPTGYARLGTSDDLLVLSGERGAVAGFDLTSGEEQTVEANLTGTADAPVWTDADGRVIRPTADGVRIDSEAGWAQVRGEHGAWLVADDPLLVTDGVTLLAVDPVPG